MTLLVGGSLLLVGASAVALLVGWVTAATELIWVSILASVGAGILLALAFVRSRAEAAVLAVPRQTAPQAPSVPRAGMGPTGPMEAARLQESRLEPAGDGEVVAVPERGKFHRPECPHAQSEGAERMSKAAARARAYSPCGICKP